MSEITFLGADNMSEPISHVKMYSDGTPMIKTGGWARIVDKANTIVVKPTSLGSFMTAMFLVDAVHLAGGSINKLVLPYVPGARQDRTNPAGDVLFTAKSVAREINSRGFESVVILDPHSPVISDSIRNVVEFPLERLALKIGRIETYDAVIAPDKGAGTRSKMFADALGIPMVQGYKVRDVSTGKLSGFSVDVEAGKHYLVADDICDGGGTFVGLGEKIAEQDAGADLFVSHGIFSKGTRDLTRIFNQVFTTDSYDSDTDDTVIKINVLKEMENYNG